MKEDNKYLITLKASIGLGCYIIATAWRLIEHQNIELYWIILGLLLIFYD